MKKILAALLAALILIGTVNVFAAGADAEPNTVAASGTDIPVEPTPEATPEPTPDAPPEPTPEQPTQPGTPTDIPTPSPDVTPVPEVTPTPDATPSPELTPTPTPDEEPEEFVHGTPIVIPPDEDDVIDFTPFEGKTWDEIIEAFFEENNIDPDTLTFGYYNTVTGEEFYHNGDKYMVAASVYKLPLNMYYAEMVYEGEIEWSTTYGNIPYEKIQRSSIESSNNELSELLQTAIGDYREYRAAIAPILGVNTHTVEEKYYEGNSFTSEQIISALKKLYSEPERYPRVEEYMFLGAPNNYFSYSEHRYAIAHKYGYLTYEGHYIFNDAAIVYTPDPILLVMFMDNCAGAITTMTRFCTLMCDYSEYTRYLRETAEAEAEAETEPPEPTTPVDSEEEAPAAETQAPVQTPVPEVTASPAPTAPTDNGKEEKDEFELTGIHKLIIVMLAAGVPAIVLLVLKNWRPASTVIAVILLMVCGVALVALITIGVGNAVNGELFPDEPKQTAAPAQTPTPTPNATSEPEKPEGITEYTITDESAEEILALAENKDLVYIDAAASSEYASLAELSALLPECQISYSMDVYGLTVSSADTELVVEDFSITDTQPLMGALACLPNMERVDIRELPLENETVEELIAAYPDIEFVWTVNAGPFNVCTEATCFSTRQSSEPKERYTSEDFAPVFKYCTELVALDLSRNALSDISGISNLTKLKVLLLGDNPGIEDVSPIAELTELEYLELYSLDGGGDFSCLAKLTKLTDLNLSFCKGVTDYSFLDSMPSLERAWLRGTGIAPANWNSLVQAYPDVKILLWHESASPTAGGWRSNDRNLAIRKAFENWEFVTDFRSWDDIDYRAEYNLTPVYPSNS